MLISEVTSVNCDGGFDGVSHKDRSSDGLDGGA